jgi:hypothetical protein
MLVAGEPFGHLRDLLLLLFDKGAKMLDGLPRVLGRDAAAVPVVAPGQLATRFEGSQNSCGACELGTRWWTVVA